MVLDMGKREVNCGYSSKKKNTKAEIFHINMAGLTGCKPVIVNHFEVYSAVNTYQYNR